MNKWMFFILGWSGGIALSIANGVTQKLAVGIAVLVLYTLLYLKLD